MMNPYILPISNLNLVINMNGLQNKRDIEKLIRDLDTLGIRDEIEGEIKILYGTNIHREYTPNSEYTSALAWNDKLKNKIKKISGRVIIYNYISLYIEIVFDNANRLLLEVGNSQSTVKLRQIHLYGGSSSTYPLDLFNNLMKDKLDFIDITMRLAQEMFPSLLDLSE